MDDVVSEVESPASATLDGRRIVVTRGGNAGTILVRRLEALGATVLHYPTISFAPPTDVVAFMHALATAGDHDWIVFTSANAVQSVAQALRSMTRAQYVALPAIAAVGPATAAAVEACAWRVDFMPTESSGDGLARELPVGNGARVLLTRADIASPSMPAILRERGSEVTDVVAYRTITDASLADAAKLNEGVDALTFTSPSTVSGFVAAANKAGWNAIRAQRERGVTVVCIGETTASAARAHGLVVDAIAENPSMDSFIEALAHALTHSSGARAGDEHPVSTAEGANE